jgi:hypothetical protein
MAVQAIHLRAMPMITQRANSPFDGIAGFDVSKACACEPFWTMGGKQ